MSLKIKDLTYEEIKKFDCGSRAHPRFPQQQKMAVHKPSLWDMVQAVKEHCRQQNRPLPYFNIEIKSHPSGDGLFTPPVEEFANLLLHEIEALGIAGLTCIQSFDVRALQAVKKQKSAAITALLVENKDSFQENIGRLGYQPEIYSCHFKLLRKKHVKKLHAKGIRVIPWTVNTAEDMRKLVKWGVDGIITDYPNLIEKS
jgi:glycerophosphoryl diester phosphodiesterase